jgi:biotin transport system permease protein
VSTDAHLTSPPRAHASGGVGLLGLYHPGTSWLHRLGPGPKAAALAALGIGVVVARGPWWALGLLAGSAVAAASARLPLRTTARGLLPVLVTATLIGGYQWWQRDWVTGVEIASDLVTVVLAATVVTATTPTDRMLDAVARAVRPLRRLGASPETVALAVALMLRAVPALVRTTTEVRDAARARGLEHDPRALLVPAAVRAVGRARLTGEALAARGLGD